MVEPVEMNLALDTPAGTIVLDKGFRYELVSIGKPYISKNTGNLTAKVTWKGICAKCGCDFEFPTGPKAPRFRRRCETHNEGWAKATPYAKAPPAPGRADIDAFLNAFCEAHEATLDRQDKLRWRAWKHTEDALWDAFNTQFPDDDAEAAARRELMS